MTGLAPLSARLSALARLVPPCRLVLDIGADHAHLPIWLLSQGRCQKALATDRRAGPLLKARANIKRAGLAHLIQTKKTDGLTGLHPQADTVVLLAGLGGITIKNILAQSPYSWPVLVIQPMRDQAELRSWLDQAGYLITKEELVRDKGFLYVVLRAEYSKTSENLSELAALVGPRILAEKPAYFYEYLSWLQQKLVREVAGQPAKQQLVDQLACLLAESEVTDGKTRKNSC